MTSLEVLEREKRTAWDDYYAATHDQPSDRYREVEPWAWVKLVNKLATIEARRCALVGVAA